MGHAQRWQRSILWLALKLTAEVFLHCLTIADCYNDLQGAVYVTDNGAYTWSAAVQETVDATLNRTVSSGKHIKLRFFASLANGANV